MDEASGGIPRNAPSNRGVAMVTRTMSNGRDLETDAKPRESPTSADGASNLRNYIGNPPLIGNNQLRDVRVLQYHPTYPMKKEDQLLMPGDLIDLIIVHHKADYELVKFQFIPWLRELLRKIKGLQEADVSIECCDSEKFPPSDVQRVEDIVNRGMRVLLFLTPNFPSDKNLKFFVESGIFKTRLEHNPFEGELEKEGERIRKYSLRPVHTEPERTRRLKYKTPIGLGAIHGIDFFDKDKAYAQHKAVDIVETAINDRNKLARRMEEALVGADELHRQFNEMYVRNQRQSDPLASAGVQNFLSNQGNLQSIGHDLPCDQESMSPEEKRLHQGASLSIEGKPVYYDFPYRFTESERDQHKMSSNKDDICDDYASKTRTAVMYIKSSRSPDDQCAMENIPVSQREAMPSAGGGFVTQEENRDGVITQSQRSILQSEVLDNPLSAPVDRRESQATATENVGSQKCSLQQGSRVHDLSLDTSTWTSTQAASQSVISQSTTQASGQASSQPTSQASSHASSQVTTQASIQAISRSTTQASDQAISQPTTKASSKVSSQATTKASSQAISQPTTQAFSRAGNEASKQTEDTGTEYQRLSSLPSDNLEVDVMPSRISYTLGSPSPSDSKYHSSETDSTSKGGGDGGTDNHSVKEKFVATNDVTVREDVLNHSGPGRPRVARCANAPDTGEPGVPDKSGPDEGKPTIIYHKHIHYHGDAAPGKRDRRGGSDRAERNIIISGCNVVQVGEKGRIQTSDLHQDQAGAALTHRSESKSSEHDSFQSDVYIGEREPDTYVESTIAGGSLNNLSSLNLNNIIEDRRTNDPEQTQNSRESDSDNEVGSGDLDYQPSEWSNQRTDINEDQRRGTEGPKHADGPVHTSPSEGRESSLNITSEQLFGDGQEQKESNITSATEMTESKEEDNILDEMLNNPEGDLADEIKSMESATVTQKCETEVLEQEEVGCEVLYQRNPDLSESQVTQISVSETYLQTDIHWAQVLRNRRQHGHQVSYHYLVKLPRTIHTEDRASSRVRKEEEEEEEDDLD